MHNVENFDLVGKADSKLVAAWVQTCALKRFLRNFTSLTVDNSEVVIKNAFEVEVIPNPDGLILDTASEHNWSLETSVKRSDFSLMGAISYEIIFQI